MRASRCIEAAQVRFACDPAPVHLKPILEPALPEAHRARHLALVDPDHAFTGRSGRAADRARLPLPDLQAQDPGSPQIEITVNLELPANVPSPQLGMFDDQALLEGGSAHGQMLDHHMIEDHRQGKSPLNLSRSMRAFWIGNPWRRRSTTASWERASPVPVRPGASADSSSSFIGRPQP